MNPVKNININALIGSLIARGIDGLVWIQASETVDPAAAGLKPEFPVVILDRPP